MGPACGEVRVGDGGLRNPIPGCRPIAHSQGEAKELFLLSSRVSLPDEILTDQGTCFMSQVMKEMCHLLHVTQLRTSVYHPQTNGLVERFNKTLKSMLRRLTKGLGSTAALPVHRPMSGAEPGVLCGLYTPGPPRSAPRDPAHPPPTPPSSRSGRSWYPRTKFSSLPPPATLMSSSMTSPQNQVRW